MTDVNDVRCLPACDEHHAEGCPRLAEEFSSWAAYFGLRCDMTREERRAQLERVRPEMKGDSDDNGLR